MTESPSKTSSAPELLCADFTLVAEDGTEIAIPLYELMTWS